MLPGLSFMVPGAAFLRPEGDDANFLVNRAPRTGIAGYVMRPRQLGALATDDERYQQRQVRVQALLAEPSTVWLLDPETSCLTDQRVLADEGVVIRIRATAIAQSVALPLDPHALTDADVQQSLLEATWGLQAGAAALTAPYLRLTAQDSTTTAVNLELLQRTAAADDRPTMAVVEGSIATLTDSRLATLGHRLRAAGADIVLLRIVGSKENASAHQVASYIRVARGLRAASLNIICDQVGRLGPLYAASIGAAFSTGSWHYRSIPTDRVPRSGGGGGSQPIFYEMPGRWRAVEPAMARQLPSARCPVEGCRALTAAAKPGDQREHFLHTITALAETIVEGDLAALLDALEGSGDPILRGWALALRQVYAESA